MYSIYNLEDMIQEISLISTKGELFVLIYDEERQYLGAGGLLLIGSLQFRSMDRGLGL
jgi:hypothetical protein